MFNDDLPNLRGYLRLLEQNGELKRETKEVSTKFEIASIHMKVQAEKGPALLFENVTGSKIPVLANLLATRRRLALSLGLSADSSYEATNGEVLQRARKRIDPIILDKGPCNEVVIEGDKVDVTKYPLVTMHEFDAGPYMTGGIVVARDPETGHQNLSFHRFLLKGKNRFGVFMEPRHLWHIYQQMEARNEPLKIAVILGYHPAIGIAGATGLPLGTNEYALAGSLAGNPIQLVKAQLSDLMVPAETEIVMEGEILPNIREPEGPYGEYTGYYGEPRPRPVFVVRKITQCQNPIYYSITARSAEEGYYFAAKTVLTLDRLKGEVPGVKAANFLQTFFFVISLRKERDGDGKKAAISAIAANDSIKYCVVVDDDVNPREPSEVLWAMATRCDPSKGVSIIPHVFGQTLDPSAEGEGAGRVWSLMIVDATKPLNAPFARRAKIPTLAEIEAMKAQGKL